jgi:hypothetical protein
VTEVKPTVLFVAYGMGESFDGPAGLDGFVKGYNRLLDMLKEASAPDARVVLISPIRHEALGEPYPDPMEHNGYLRAYTGAIGKIAKERGARFVNLFDSLIADGRASQPLTENGIHLSPAGYFKAALEIERQLGYAPRGWKVTADVAKGSVDGAGAKASLARAEPPAAAAITVDAPLAPGAATGATSIARGLKVSGLADGTYALKADGKTLATATAKQWANGVELTSPDDPAVARVEKLRTLLVAKNVQYFNKYRPANETYIFLFRKGEQGRNAVEIPQFDGPIAQLEAEVAKLRKPGPVTYTLVKE